MAQLSNVQKRAIRMLKHRVQYKSARFTLPSSEPFTDDTSVIRETTRLYVESWILPLLDALENNDTDTLNKLV